MTKPTQLSDAEFEQVIQADLPILIDLWAEWCGPCKMISPLVDEIAQEYEGKLRVAKLNVDDNPETPMRFGVMSIPTLLLFKNGKLVERLAGYMPKDRILNKIKPHLS